MIVLSSTYELVVLESTKMLCLLAVTHFHCLSELLKASANFIYTCNSFKNIKTCKTGNWKLLNFEKRGKVQLALKQNVMKGPKILI